MKKPCSEFGLLVKMMPFAFQKSNLNCPKFFVPWSRMTEIHSADTQLLSSSNRNGPKLSIHEQQDFFGDDYAQNALQQEWGNFPFANWNGICWGLLLQLVQLIKIHFLPHLESFIWERKFEKKFFKKSHTQTPNGVLLIFKLPYPNGSYRNGVCRALWALDH